MTNQPSALGEHEQYSTPAIPVRGAGHREASLECDEAEFVVCCFALCDWGTYSIDNGEVRIRGKA